MSAHEPPKLKQIGHKRAHPSLLALPPPDHPLNELTKQVPLDNNGHIDEGAEITAWDWDVSVKQNDIMETISIFGHVKQLNLPPLSIVTIAAVNP